MVKIQVRLQLGLHENRYPDTISHAAALLPRWFAVEPPHSACKGKTLKVAADDRYPFPRGFDHPRSKR